MRDAVFGPIHSSLRQRQEFVALNSRFYKHKICSNTSQNFSAAAVSAIATLPHTLTLWKPARCLNLLNQPFLEPSKTAVA
jgi:hypothetical protein